MKTIINFIVKFTWHLMLSGTFLILTVTVGHSQQIESNAIPSESIDNIIAELNALRHIEGVEIGSLICENDDGKWVLCTGSPFEKIEGFCTNVPYVTANKAQPNEKQDEFTALASMKNGVIIANDRICVCKDVGLVKKCDKDEEAYGIALTNANTQRSKFIVKVFGKYR
ncbi:MAG TPA: hypothetical protein QF753_22930 [Victivallales bacterium]|nr:hypothetical protein [Victivallales bacterium]